MNENLNGQNANGQNNFNGQKPPQPPTSDGTQPTFDGTQPPQPPTSDGTEQPTSDGSQPTFDGTQPTFDGQQPPQPPTSDGSQMPTLDGSQMPMMPPPRPMMGGGMHQPPMMGGNMWGNAGFAGEEMLNGNNFAHGNFGEQSDLSGLVDSSTEISVNLGQQNTFGNFAQGGMMPPPMFGGQGGQFNQAPQQAAQTQAE